MGRADWETLLLLYLLFGTKYTRPIFQVNPSITTLSTFAPFLPHHRRVTQELALNSLAKVREESRSLSPDRWLFFSFFPRLSRRRFVWAAVSRSKVKVSTKGYFLPWWRVPLPGPRLNVVGRGGSGPRASLTLVLLSRCAVTNALAFVESVTPPPHKTEDRAV